MVVRQYADPAAFLQQTRGLLEEHEAENNLILGVSSWLAEHPERIEKPPCLLTVEEKTKVRAAGMMTPPYKLVVTRATKKNLATIASHLSRKRIKLPGVNGPTKASRTFAELWAEETGCSFKPHRALRIYELTRVVPPRVVDGRFRLASRNDEDRLAGWIGAFSDDIGESRSEKEVHEILKTLLTDQRLYVWEDNVLRSMAAWSGPTKHGIRINLVYTPPEFRGHGYASACVAALSKSMLDSGRRFCYLFTDLSNPISNRIYQRIGYRAVCDFTEHLFEP